MVDEIGACDKLPPGPQRDKCKDEAKNRFFLKLDMLNELERKSDSTSGQKPTPQSQPAPQSKKTTQPPPAAKQPTPPTPQAEQPTKPADFAKKRLEAKAELNQELDKCHKLKPEECEKCKQEANKRYNLKIKQINEMSKAKTAPTSGQKPTPQPQPTPSAKQPTKPTPQAKQPTQPQPAPSKPSKPPHTEDIPNLGQVPCVDLAESPHRVDQVVATREKNSFNCHFYTKAYLRTIDPANDRRLSQRASGRDECLTDEDLSAVGFRPVPSNRARVGDIIVVEGTRGSGLRLSPQRGGDRGGQVRSHPQAAAKRRPRSLRLRHHPGSVQNGLSEPREFQSPSLLAASGRREYSLERMASKSAVVTSSEAALSHSLMSRIMFQSNVDKISLEKVLV